MLGGVKSKTNWLYGVHKFWDQWGIANFLDDPIPWSFQREPFQPQQIALIFPVQKAPKFNSYIRLLLRIGKNSSLASNFFLRFYRGEQLNSKGQTLKGIEEVAKKVHWTLMEGTTLQTPSFPSFNIPITFRPTAKTFIMHFQFQIVPYFYEYEYNVVSLFVSSQKSIVYLETNRFIVLLSYNKIG